MPVTRKKTGRMRLPLPAEEHSRTGLTITITEQFGPGKASHASYPGSQSGVAIVKVLLDAPENVLLGMRQLIDAEIKARGL